MNIRMTGILLFVGCCLWPLYWYVPLLTEYDKLAIFSQYLGSLALICMAFSQLIATRISGLESIFGGLDRIYVFHKWIGIIAISAILLHDTIDAEIDNLGPEDWLVDVAETLGEFSLYAILILLVISLVTVIPYPMWRFSHKFMGSLFALSSFHYIFMLKPFSIGDPLGAYILAFCLLGLLCYVITLLPFKVFAGRASYKVTKLEANGGATAIDLAPLTRGIKHRAGQFSFISIQKPGLEEPHPFTISCAPKEDCSLQFTIKGLGDYTRKFSSELDIGDRVQISKAFGHFNRPTSNKEQIWIASGIGITPFIAWLDLPPLTTPVTLYYSYRGEALAPHLTQLKQRCEHLDNLSLVLIDTMQSDRLNAQQVAQHSPQLAACEVYYCGPSALRDTLQRDLNLLGLKHRHFHYEVFELRTGIDLSNFFAKAYKIIAPFYLLLKNKVGKP